MSRCSNIERVHQIRKKKREIGIDFCGSYHSEDLNLIAYIKLQGNANKENICCIAD